MRLFNFQKGLTLAEMLVVLAVLTIVGVLLLNIFTSTLRGNNKTQIVSAIKQNGQSVLEQMDKTVRNADNVCVSPGLKTLIVIKNGIYTRYRFFLASTTVNGSIQQDNPVKQTDPNTGKEETDPVFIDRVCSDVDPMSQITVLTDTNPQTGVSIECIDNNCNPPNEIFKNDSSSGFKDQVTIRFAVWPGVLAPQAVRGQIDPVTFQTTITLR